MLAPNQRAKVNLAHLTIRGFAFSENVREVLTTVGRLTASDLPTYLVELLFSFKGVKRVEVLENRIRRSLAPFSTPSSSPASGPPSRHSRRGDSRTLPRPY